MDCLYVSEEMICGEDFALDIKYFNQAIHVGHLCAPILRFVKFCDLKKIIKKTLHLGIQMDMDYGN